MSSGQSRRRMNGLHRAMATAWRFRVLGDRVTDGLAFSTRLQPLAQALRLGGPMPQWVPVKR
jgi:hypothetical protein